MTVARPRARRGGGGGGGGGGSFGSRRGGFDPDLRCYQVSKTQYLDLIFLIFIFEHVIPQFNRLD